MCYLEGIKVFLPSMQTNPTRPVIRITGLTKRFGDLVAVDALSLDIFQGEILGFLGPNGAGKSTSINMICGLTRADTGEISLFGSPAGPESRFRFGLCPQDIICWPKLTCLEQLVFMGEMYGMLRREAEKSALELLGALGLDSKRGALASTLSGGMKRRLNLCLALVHHPDVVILDEPEAGLDPQSRILVRDYIRQLRRQKTVILTTHNMDEADRLSDRVAIIDNGKLLLADTPENLKKTIGTGDILEVVPEAGEDGYLDRATACLKGISDHVTLSGERLLVVERNALDLIPRITSALQEGGIRISSVNIRTATLEDVFIQLTGRRLRES